MKKFIFVLIMPFIAFAVTGCKNTTYSYGPNGSKVTEHESGVGTRVHEEYYDSSTGLIHHRESFIPDKKEAVEDKEDSKIKRMVLDLEGKPIFAFPENREGVVIKGFYEVHFFKEGLPKVLYTDLQNQKFELLVLPKSSDDDNRHYRTIKAGAKKISSLGLKDSRDLIRERFDLRQQGSGVVAHVKIENLPSNLSDEATLCAKSSQVNAQAICSAVQIQASAGETAPISIGNNFLKNLEIKGTPSVSSLVFTLKLNGVEKVLEGKLESAEITSNDNGVSGDVHTRFTISNEVAALLHVKAIQEIAPADPSERRVTQSRSVKQNNSDDSAIVNAVTPTSKVVEAL